MNSLACGAAEDKQPSPRSYAEMRLASCSKHRGIPKGNRYSFSPRLRDSVLR